MAGGASAGQAQSIPERTLVKSAGRSVVNGLIETTQGIADSTSECGAGGTTARPIMPQCPPMCRQQDMDAGCIPAAMLSAGETTASAQAGAAAGAPAQRTLTKTTMADAGKSDCVIKSTQSSQEA